VPSGVVMQLEKVVGAPGVVARRCHWCRRIAFWARAVGVSRLWASNNYLFHFANLRRRTLGLCNRITIYRAGLGSAILDFGSPMGGQRCLYLRAFYYPNVSTTGERDGPADPKKRGCSPLQIGVVSYPFLVAGALAAGLVGGRG